MTACVYVFTGSVMSLMAGLVFGGLSAYGALNLSIDPRDIKISFCKYGSVHSNMPTGCNILSKSCCVVPPLCLQWPLDSCRLSWE